MTQKNSVLWSVISIIALIATVVVNALANIIPFNGMNTGEVANQYDIFFFPAAYVFSIWTVIYIGLAIFVVYQLLPSNRSNTRLQAVAPWFVLNSALNSVWMVAWHYNAVLLSVLFMLGILTTLLVIYYKLRIPDLEVSLHEQVCARLPFRIYLGWISVATIANISTWLFTLDIHPFGLPDPTWAAIMIVVAGLLAIAMLFRFRDIWFAAVVVWAVLGIMVRFPEIESIQFTAGVSSSILLGMLIAGLYLQFRHQLIPLHRKKQ